MRCGWENWDEQDGGEVLRLHSVLHPGYILVSQERDHFRIVPDITGVELSAQYITPDCLDAFLTSLAKQVGDDCHDMPLWLREMMGFPPLKRKLLHNNGWGKPATVRL